MSKTPRYLNLSHAALIAAFAAVVLLAAWVQKGAHSSVVVVSSPNAALFPTPTPTPTGQVAGALTGPVNARGENTATSSAKQLKIR